jgi:hypothetical protein
VTELVKRVDRLDGKFDELPEEYIPRRELTETLKTMTYYSKDLERRLANMEDNQKWIVRTVGGSILLAIMTLVLIGKKTGAM